MIFLSAPVDRHLLDHQLSAKEGLKKLLASQGFEVQEFGVSGLPANMPWTADAALEVMRKCDGVLVLAFSRFEFIDDTGKPVRIPTEYNHYEGALALALGLPTFVLADQGLPSRGILFPAVGVPIVELPQPLPAHWLFDPQMDAPLKQWMQAVRQHRRYHSCFISYSGKDDAFCQRLYSGLQRAGLDVWFAPQDIKAGKKIHEQVREAIQRYDKLLLVLSEKSLASEWVEHEIRLARKREAQEKRRVLFPLRLVDYPALEAWSCFDADTKKDLASEIREYYIPDFSTWQDPASFDHAFTKFVHDLRSEEADEDK